jgi:hypothetical protein
MLNAQVASSTSIRAYAATQGSGYAVWLFNLDENKYTPIDLTLQGAAKPSFSVSTTTYGKAQYDDSQPPPGGPGVWTGPVSQSLGAVASSAAIGLTLPPWSMTVLVAQ